ncbi:MAG: hypothetical protein QXV17_13995 [Candidatus Micrarchaeaceae archaeon]
MSEETEKLDKERKEINDFKNRMIGLRVKLKIHNYYEIKKGTAGTIVDILCLGYNANGEVDCSLYVMFDACNVETKFGFSYSKFNKYFEVIK